MSRKSILLLFVFIAWSVHAADIRMSGANRAEYWVFVDEALDSTNVNYKEHLTEKLKLSLTYQDITLRGVFFFWDPTVTLPGELQYFDFSAQYAKDPVKILYGRFYETFGRGLVLNQFLDEDFNNDNSLYGLRTEISMFNSSVILLTGTPRNIFFEELSYNIKNDTTDQIRGANLSTKIPFPKTRVNIQTVLSGRYVRVNRLIDMNPMAFTELFGGDITFTLGPWQSYFEYGRQMGTKPLVGGRLTGNGYLATTSFALPGFGLTLQYVDYDTLGFGGPGYRYNEPPTPIKSGVSVNRGIDEIGYGVSLIVSPVDILSLELNHNKVSTHDTTLSKFAQIIGPKIIELEDDASGVLEQTAKIILHPTFDLEITTAIERVTKQGIEPPVEKKEETKPYIDVTYDFGSFFIETGYEHTFISSDTSDYYDHAASISIGKPELFVLSVRYERRNRVPEWLIPKLGDETSWPMVELSLDLTNRHNLRLRVGAEKGGLVCSGGVCRFEEPFKGIKLVLTSIL
jgi:hypothetical protein